MTVTASPAPTFPAIKPVSYLYEGCDVLDRDMFPYFIDLELSREKFANGTRKDGRQSRT